MNISFTVEFCSQGSFTPGLGDINCWIGTDSWENQYGSGRYLEINLIWLSFLLEYSRKKHKSFVREDENE